MGIILKSKKILEDNMNYFIYLGILLILIIIIAFPIPLKISIKFVNNKFNMYLYNFEIKKKKKPKVAKEEKEFIGDSLKEKYRHFTDVKNNIFKGKTKIKTKLNLKIEYGLSDPFETAMVNGLLWAILSFLLSYSLNYINYKDKKIIIKPDFKKQYINILITGIIYLNIAKIIHIIFLVLKHKLHKKDKSKVT